MADKMNLGPEIDEAFSANTYEDESGCWIWTGPRSLIWDYPIAWIPSSKAPVNIRLWYANIRTKRRRYVSFYRADCGHNDCVRPEHMALVEQVPIDAVRAMEQVAKAERA